MASSVSNHISLDEAYERIRLWYQADYEEEIVKVLDPDYARRSIEFIRNLPPCKWHDRIREARRNEGSHGGPARMGFHRFGWLPENERVCPRSHGSVRRLWT